MAMKNANEIVDQDMVLPIGDKNYSIPPASAETGMMLERLTQFAVLAQGKGHREPTKAELEALDLDDAAEHLHMRAVLGPAFDEMVADGVRWPTIRLALQAATIWALDSREAAEELWNNGGRRPKARRKPADRKPGAKSAPRASTGSKSPKKK